MRRTLAFVISFSTFLVACVDHAHIGGKENLSDVLVPQCLYRLAPFHAIALFFFVCFWIWEALRLVFDIPQLITCHQIYTHLLDIPGNDQIIMMYIFTVQMPIFRR